MVRICPKCKSSQIIFAGETAAWAAFRTGQMYHCKDCGYTGPLVVDVDEANLKRLRGEKD